MCFFHPVFAGIPRAANRSEIWEHRKAELENPVDKPQHFPCCRHRSGGVSCTEDVAIAYDCAQDIYLVAAPLNHRAYNKEKDENMDKMRKRRFLQKVEGISVIKKAAKAQNSKEEKLKRELWETMIATFMNNIQLQVHR